MWGKIRDGEDLAIIREKQRNRARMTDLCSRYLEEHAREHKKASSAHLDERNIENHIRPLLGDLYVDEVTRADVDRFKRAIREGKTRRKGESGGRAFVAASSSVAARWLRTDACHCSLRCSTLPRSGAGGRRAPNPVRHIEKYREERRERFLSADEFARLSDALAKAEEGGQVSPFAIAAIRVLIFTGARLGEVLTLKWEHVDLEQGVLKLPDSKTGPKDDLAQPAGHPTTRGTPPV